MFTIMRYYAGHLINGIGNFFNQLMFLLSNQEAPRNLKKLSDNGDDKSFTDFDMSSLISEDESQINESNLEIDSVPVTPVNLISCSSRTADDPNSEFYNLEDAIKSLQFDDTLDEVEFMMEQGLKILNNTGRDSATPKSTKKPSITPNYDYVKSPISMYIKYSPMTPLRRSNNIHQRVCIETLSEHSTICEDAKNNNQAKMLGQGNHAIFPRRAYVNAARNQIIYENVTQRREGARKQKLPCELKKSPTVIKHYGRLRTKALSQRKENIPIDDSFNDFSMDYGDISLHVVKKSKPY